MGPVSKTSHAMDPFSGRLPCGYSLIWSIQGCAAGQGMSFFTSLLRESVLNRVYILCESVLIINRRKFVCTPPVLLQVYKSNNFNVNLIYCNCQ